jgi:hypothetical protein
MSSQSIEDKQTQTLNTINDLQNLEKQLYINLENAANNNNTVEQEQLIARINNLSATRVSLFNSLKSMYETAQNNVVNTRNLLEDKMIVSKVMENELSNLDNNISDISDAKANKLRMVEINTYFGKRYTAHTDIMKLIIAMCSAALIVVILMKKYIIPFGAGSLLISLILGVGAFFIIRNIWDLTQRDNMDYDKYKTFGSYKKSDENNYDYNMKFSDFNGVSSPLDNLCPATATKESFMNINFNKSEPNGYSVDEIKNTFSQV